MNTRTAEITAKFPKSVDDGPEVKLRVAEAFEILFRECGIESFFHSHKNNIGLVRTNGG